MPSLTDTNSTVSLLAEIPSGLHGALETFLETHKGWGQEQVFTAALSMFLMQNGISEDFDSRQYQEMSRMYLDSVLSPHQDVA